MQRNTREKHAYTEADILAAITAYKSKEFTSIRACANAFSIPFATFHARLFGTTSRSHAKEPMQILSVPEEKTLVRWITHLTKSGFPASPALVVQMAEEIRSNRYRLSKTTPPSHRPIGKSWLDRFRVRHPDIQGVWARKIDGARYKAMNMDTVKTWFDVVVELCVEHKYSSDRIYNMDESGFAVGESQSSRALVNLREKSSWKVISGRQQWITAIECISASGTALPPLIIFKAKHTNTGWIPVHAPPDWRFSTSNSGWTSDSHAYEWLTTVFEPTSRPIDPTLRRLLIMDGHGSHITANVIAYCMEHAIDLLVLPPHTSHMLQPLDVSVFSPLKRALAVEADHISSLDPGREQRVQWTEMYIRARQRAFTSANILSGWRATGLRPLSPIVVLEKLATAPTTRSSPPHTPSRAADLDLSILSSSPPDGTELRAANRVLHTELEKVTGLPSPIKRYTKRMTRALEATQSENVTLRKRVAEQEELLRTRKARKKGKRVALEGRFVFSTEEVLQIAREAEEETRAKKRRARSNMRSTSVEIDQAVDDVLENVSSEAESDCIVVAMVRDD